MLVLTPVGATLHAMTHLGHAPLRVLAALQTATGTASKAAGRPNVDIASNIDIASNVDTASNVDIASNVHTASNVDIASNIDSASITGDTAYHADAAIAATDDDDGQGPDAHCHTCDEWQVLDHVLTPAPLLALPPPSLLPHVVPTPRPALLARSPWILPRAPPAQA